MFVFHRNWLYSSLSLEQDIAEGVNGEDKKSERVATEKANRKPKLINNVAYGTISGTAKENKTEV